MVKKIGSKPLKIPRKIVQQNKIIFFNKPKKKSLIISRTSSEIHSPKEEESREFFYLKASITNQNSITCPAKIKQNKNTTPRKKNYKLQHQIQNMNNKQLPAQKSNITFLTSNSSKQQNSTPARVACSKYKRNRTRASTKLQSLLPNKTKTT